jgi:DNA modification methylase
MYVIANLSYENDLVIDPFLGSGTTAVAARRSALEVKLFVIWTGVHA